MQCLRFEVINELFRFGFDVVILQSWIVFDGFISAYIIETESRGWAVMIVVDVCENVGTFVSVVLVWAPDHLHAFVVEPDFFVLVVDSCEEEWIEAELREQGGSCRVMPEGINVPSYVRYVVEGIFEPSETNSHLINKIFVVHVGFIWHAPSCIHEMKLLIGNDPSHGFSLFFWGLIPPSVEESHFDDSKFVWRVIGKLGDDGIDGILDSCELCPHVSTVVVVVDSFEPSYIIVWVWDEVDCETGPVFGIFFVVMFLHHVLVGISLGWMHYGE